MRRALFAVLLVAALGMFAWTVRRFARMILAGRPDGRFDHPGARVDSVLLYFFGQKKVVEKTTIPAKRLPRFVSAMGSKYHFFIFWGFIFITVGTVETIVGGLFPAFSWAGLLGHTAGGVLVAIIDAFSLAVLLLVGFAFFRRIVLQPRLIPMSRDAAAILGAIGLLMLSYFGMRRLDGAAAEICWWVHVVILLAFLNYLLYSKHSHILAALPNIYFRKLGQRGVLPKLNMEADDIAATGVVEGWKDFTWKSLLDGFACTECARCTNFCPAYNTGKPLSPMQVIHDLRDDLRTRMPDRGPLDTLLDKFQHGSGAKADAEQPLIGGRTTEDVLWACTTCGACQEVCPVFIDHPEKIIQMRQ
ncbi:MAG TPA: (Fe-S)-binding protein, partial [Polyangia bacterium]